MHHDAITSKVVNPPMEDEFNITVLTVSVESDKEVTPEDDPPVEIDLKSVDIIYNPEYEKIKNSY